MRCVLSVYTKIKNSALSISSCFLFGLKFVFKNHASMQKGTKKEENSAKRLKKCTKVLYEISSFDDTIYICNFTNEEGLLWLKQKRRRYIP